MTDLAVFVAARLDEEQATASLADDGHGPWEAVQLGQMDYAKAAHIARWDPARVLREVDAKRGILSAYLAAEKAMRDGDDTRWRAGEVFGLAGAVAILASEHSDHPDYDPEWGSS